MAFSLDDLSSSIDSALGIDSDDSDDSSSSSVGGSLADLASSAITQIGGAAVQSAVRSQSAAPAPDLTAAAAKGAAASFLNSSALGVSLPILLIGGGALLFLFLKKR